MPKDPLLNKPRRRLVLDPSTPVGAAKDIKEFDDILRELWSGWNILELQFAGESAMPQLRKNIDDLWDNGEVGDWAFRDGPATEESPAVVDRYIVIRLPDTDSGSGYKDFAVLPLQTSDRPDGQCWQWDGNREAPTLTPSILHHSVPPWHGYMRAGKLEVA